MIYVVFIVGVVVGIVLGHVLEVLHYNTNEDALDEFEEIDEEER